MTLKKTKEEDEMKEAVDESLAVEGNIVASEDAAVDQTLAVQQQKTIAVSGGFDIEGLNDVPMNVLPVPFVKLVQPTSQKIDLGDGKEAPVGTYYFTDIQAYTEELEFVLLRAKYQVKEFEREVNGKMTMVPTKQMLLLGMTLENKKLFILTLSVMSFTPFGRLISKFKDEKVAAVWEHKVIATSIRTENKKGKFYVADFKMDEKLSTEEMQELAMAYGEYGGVLDREDIQEAAGQD